MGPRTDPGSRIDPGRAEGGVRDLGEHSARAVQVGAGGRGV
ncbi:hypothetical protein SERN_1648 [Serinibacter arcticus]|uniref:Uncharacterized protein n=1 Tax=Serinibacter arcticus TaxID=1655435 RepID=A0A4Z1E152_9MICO|nr:hypothetical protein SERN_1648 [Serinibacter arcticus]